MPELDALRFFAFLSVFACHVPLNGEYFYRLHHWGIEPWRTLHNLIDSGGFGVDLFFTLSAFLITTLLLRERDATGKLDIWSFYLRRMLRI